MKKYIPYILSLCLVMWFSFLTAEDAFSQATQNQSKVDTISHANPDGPVKGITPGRARSLVGSAMALISVIVGWRAKIRAKRGKGGTEAIVAVLLGLTGIILSVIHLSASYGAALGSGSGKAGAFVALVLGLIGLILGGLALRSGRNKTEH